MTAPDFFIVGAPKCGTTALASYLAAHPDIFMCVPKEPHFFADDFPNHRYVDRWEDYLDLFSGAGGCRAVGEASVFYLLSDVAVPNIMGRVPSARIIVMLRNPVELAQSMHAQALSSRDETETRFDVAWNLRDARRQGRHIPRNCRQVKALLYDELASLGGQLQRLLQVVPRDQVQWWFHDDFAADPGRVYREVLAFLDVPDDGRTVFPKVNVRKKARLQWLAEFTQKPPGWLVDLAIRMKKSFGIRRWGVLGALRSANFTSARREPAPVALEEEMAVVFRDDIERLQAITGRDLSHWYRRSPRTA